MAMAQYRLLSCTPSERMALILIRKAAAGAAAPESAAFAILATTASRHGIAILPVEASFLGEGEVRLLAFLARAQRVTDTSTALLPRSLRAAVGSCADELTSRSLRLPHVTIQRQQFIDGAALADLYAGPFRSGPAVMALRT